MNVFDEAEIIFGAAGLPGTGLTAGEKTTINSRLTDLEGDISAIPDSIDDMTDVDLSGIASGDLLQWDGAGLVKYTPSTTVTFAITLIIDGGSSAITPGVKGDIHLPFACTLVNATLLASQTGSVQIDVWKDTYTNFPPTDGDSITASAPLAIVSGMANSNNMTGWTKSIAGDDVLRFNVDSATTIQRVTVTLRCTRDI